MQVPIICCSTDGGDADYSKLFTIDTGNELNLPHSDKGL